VTVLHSFGCGALQRYVRLEGNFEITISLNVLAINLMQK
jgi:hypothetical protein